MEVEGRRQEGTWHLALGSRLDDVVLELSSRGKWAVPALPLLFD